MFIRSTTDPITLKDVHNLASHPSVIEGTPENGFEVFFENEINKQAFLLIKLEDKKVLEGNDTDDYIAEG